MSVCASVCAHVCVRALGRERAREHLCGEGLLSMCMHVCVKEQQREKEGKTEHLGSQRLVFQGFCSPCSGFVSISSQAKMRNDGIFCGVEAHVLEVIRSHLCVHQEYDLCVCALYPTCVCDEGKKRHSEACRKCKRKEYQFLEAVDSDRRPRGMNL